MPLRAHAIVAATAGSQATYVPWTPDALSPGILVDASRTLPPTLETIPNHGSGFAQFNMPSPVPTTTTVNGKTYIATQSATGYVTSSANYALLPPTGFTAVTLFRARSSEYAISLAQSTAQNANLLTVDVTTDFNIGLFDGTWRQRTGRVRPVAGDLVLIAQRRSGTATSFRDYYRSVRFNGDQTLTMGSSSVAASAVGLFAYAGGSPANTLADISSVVHIQSAASDDDFNRLVGWAAWNGGAPDLLPLNSPYRFDYPKVKTSADAYRPWTFADLGSAVKLWLDPSDTSTITVTGSGVSEWRDKSGNARHFGQSTDNLRPTQTTINGLNAIQYDGANDFLSRNVEAWMYGYPLSFMAVFRATSFGAAYNGLAGFYSDTAGTTAGWAAFVRNTGKSSVYATSTTGQPNYDGTGALTFQTATTNVFLSDIADNAIAGYGNGSADGSSSGTWTLRSNLGSGTVSIGADQRFSRYTNWAIGDVLIADRLSQADRDRAFGYAHHKWGSASLLPLNSPYRFAPPMVAVTSGTSSTAAAKAGTSVATAAAKAGSATATARGGASCATVSGKAVSTAVATGAVSRFASAAAKTGAATAAARASARVTVASGAGAVVGTATAAARAGARCSVVSGKAGQSTAATKPAGRTAAAAAKTGATAAAGRAGVWSTAATAKTGAAGAVARVSAGCALTYTSGEIVVSVNLPSGSAQHSAGRAPQPVRSNVQHARRVNVQTNFRRG